MRNDTKKITQGAMAVAFMAIFALLNRFSGGFVEVYGIFFTPLPMIIYCVQYGYKDGLVVLVSAILISFLFADFYFLFALFASYITGYAIGCGLYYKLERKLNLIIAFVINFVANYLSMVVFSAFFGYDLNGEMDEIISIMNQYGLSGVIETSTIAKMLPIFLFFSIVLISLMTAYVSYMLAIIILKRIKLYHGEIVNKNSLKPSKWVGYVLMAGLFMYVFAGYFKDNDSLYAFLLGTGMCCVFVLAYYGLKGLSLFGRINNIRYMSLILILCIVFAYAIFLLLFALCGFLFITTNIFERKVDSWFKK